MAGPEALWFRLLKRRQMVELGNRVLALLLAGACLYLLLLGAVLLTGLSLLGFHLVLYVGLSLFPVFLLLPPRPGWLLREVRRLDERCLLEAYLSTESGEHRAFMAQAVTELLERAEPGVRFALSPASRRLALVCGCLLLLFEAASYLTLFRLEPSLSARALRERLAQREAAEAAARSGGVPRPELSGTPEPAEQPAAEAPAEAPGEAAAEAPEDRLEGLRRPEAGQEPEAPQGRRDRGEQAAPVPVEGRPQRILLPVEAEQGGSPALSESSEPGVTGLQGEPDRAEAGAGDTGRSFLESPLRGYRGVPQRVEARGGEELAAASSLAERQPDPQITALFADFAAALPPGVDFDPLLEQIRNRYLELLDERY